MDTPITTFTYDGQAVSFQPAEGSIMVNATEMAKPFGKTPKDWLRTQSAQEFINSLSAVRQICPTELVKTVQGGEPAEQGTWMHEDVAVEFARWLSPKFAIWCNDRIKELLRTGRTSLNLPTDYLSALKELVASEEARIAAERKAEEEEAKKNRLIDVCVQKSDIIHGLTDGIPLADLRQRLNQIVRQRCRIKNAGFKGGALDYIDAQMHRLPELFEIACRLFQSEYESLKASWENMAVEAYKASHFDTFEYI